MIAPGPTVDDAYRALAFGAQTASTPFLSVPEPEHFPEAFSTVRTIAQDMACRPVAVVAEPDSIMRFLQRPCSDEPGQVNLRQALVGGLIVLDRQVESVLNQSVLRRDERPLYRSDHEQILHKLLVHDSGIVETFETNHRVKGKSRKYEIDLWCAALKLAVEVDGAQHVSSDIQRRKDAQRDADLAQAGIVTIRVHAAEVMGDPTGVLTYVRARIEQRRKEISP